MLLTCCIDWNQLNVTIRLKFVKDSTNGCNVNRKEKKLFSSFAGKIAQLVHYGDEFTSVYKLLDILVNFKYWNKLI